MTDLTEHTLLVRNPEIVCGDIDGELIALKIDTGSYLHMNATASHILSLFDDSDAPLSVAGLCERIRRQYRVDQADCLRDVRSLVERCLELDMLRIAKTD